MSIAKADLRKDGEATGAIYLVAALGSLILSGWCAWAESVPNPDGTLYLRAAELFARGDWNEGLKLYGWPFYSFIIAQIMATTGLNALLSAQVANAAFGLLTTLAFIGLASRLSGRDPYVVSCAAAVILLHPQVAQMRGEIIRDNGYLSLLLCALYFVARDLRDRQIANKFVAALATVVAALFRIEGFALLVLILFFYLAGYRGRWKSHVVVGAACGVVLLLIPGILFWDALRSGSSIGAISDKWGTLQSTLAFRLHLIRDEVLKPWGAGNSWGAYVGMVIGIVTVNLVRAVTIPLGCLAMLSFLLRDTMGARVRQFVLWFLLGQLPVLFVFAFVHLLLDKRYAMGVSLVSAIPSVFLLARAIREWSVRRFAKPFFFAAIAVLVGAWISGIPKPSKLVNLKLSGQWIAANLPADARVLTNDSRIAYFSGRTFGKDIQIWSEGFDPPLSDSELEIFQYFALVGPEAGRLPESLSRVPNARLVRTFPGGQESVLIYKTGNAF